MKNLFLFFFRLQMGCSAQDIVLTIKIIAVNIIPSVTIMILDVVLTTSAAVLTILTTDGKCKLNLQQL